MKIVFIRVCISDYYSYKPIGTDGRAFRRHVTVSHTIIRPHIIKQDPYPEGSDVDIMYELSDRLGFSYNFTPATSFSHLVQLIADGKADMSVSNAAGDLHRYRLGIDFLALMYRRYVFVYRHPIPIQAMYTITLPFTLAVWGAILASVFAIMLTLTWLNK